MKITGKLIIITVFGVLIAVGILTYRQLQLSRVITRQTAINQPVVKPLVLPKPRVQPVHEPVKPAIPHVSVQEIKKPQDTLKYVIENFDLPREIKEDLIFAQIEEENSVALEPVGIAEVKAVVDQTRKTIISGRLQNCAAGYYLPDKKFQEILVSALPEPAITDNTDTTPQQENIANPTEPDASQSTQAQDNQVRILTSDALATLGLIAMSRLEYSQAQEAFQSLISYYPNAQETPIARLELARLMYEQNRWDEARKIVDEALVYYAEDNEYKEIALALNAAYLRNE